MNKQNLLIVLLVGALLGSLVTYYVSPKPQTARFAEVLPANMPDAPQVSVAEAEVMREERYASINTIAETLALPTDFAETEALYALAGRSSSGEIQDLIYEAAGIRDRTDRRAALGILFLRLSELDPKSALAIARTPTFVVEKNYETKVWVAWGRLDLVGALHEAEKGTSVEKNRAAQALYISARGLKTGDADLIHATLGILPGREAKAQHLYALADQSPVDAIRYIESLSSPSDQREHFRWLALHLSRSGVGAKADYAELIQSAAQRRQFEESLAAQDLRFDPEATLDRILSGPMTAKVAAQAYSALQRLAAQDPTKAMEMLARLPDSDNAQQHKASVIAVIARTDPEMALAWARDNDTSSDQSLLVGILGQLAQHDPQLVLAELQTVENGQARDQLMTAAAMAIGQTNPAEAVQVVMQVSNEQVRANSVAQLAAVWAQSDLEGAINWVASLDADGQRRAIQMMGQNLVRTDIDKAILLVDRFPGDSARGLAMQVATNLVRSRSVESAQAFIERYKGSPGYDELQSGVISMAAHSNPERAMQLARNLESGRARDKLYAQIITRQAAHDPQQALEWMASINNESSRARAAAQVAAVWYSRDPTAATSWIKGLPSGNQRDDAIIAAASSAGPNAESVIDLLDSVEDPEKRKQAITLQIRMLSHTNPAAAERLLNNTDLSPEERASLEKYFYRTGPAYFN